MAQTRARLARLTRALDVRRRVAAVQESRVWTPFPGPQALAYESPADVLGYGGAAGGGKSQLLLGLSVTRHVRSIIFRREATQGRGLVDDARLILGDMGRLNENTGVWRDLPGGRQIEFAGVKDHGDEQKFKGRPHDLVCYDEADQFTEYMVRFLQGWNRTSVPGQRCRVVMAFNPPSSAEGRWIVSYFGPWLDPKHPRPAAPGELRWYATLPDGREVERLDGEPFEVRDERTGRSERITPRSRTFVPARVQDNPALMATNYVATLQAMPEPLRSQLLYGDFRAGVQDDVWQVIPTAWVEAAMARWRPDGRGHRPLDCVGADVARGGDDQTVFAPRFGTWFGRLQKYPGRQTVDGPAAAALLALHLNVERTPANAEAVINVDIIGVGGAAYDSIKGLGLDARPINFAAKSGKRDRSGRLALTNLRAEAYWKFREALDPNSGENLALPPDPELLADLTAPRWANTAAGIRIESKDEIVKRLKRSPDRGDAVVLAHLGADELVVSSPAATRVDRSWRR